MSALYLVIVFRGLANRCSSRGWAGTIMSRGHCFDMSLSSHYQKPQVGGYADPFSATVQFEIKGCGSEGYTV